MHGILIQSLQIKHTFSIYNHHVFIDSAVLIYDPLTKGIVISTAHFHCVLAPGDSDRRQASGGTVQTESEITLSVTQ